MLAAWKQEGYARISRLEKLCEIDLRLLVRIHSRLGELGSLKGCQDMRGECGGMVTRAGPESFISTMILLRSLDNN